MTQDAGIPHDLTKLRFVEIGRPFVKRVFPEQTLCFSSEMPKKGGARGAEPTLCSEPLWRLPGALADPAVAVVVCHPSMFAPWDWRWLSRAVFSRRLPQAGLPISSVFGPQLLRGVVAAPIAIVDLEDLPVVNRCSMFLLDRAAAYFKRELPTDHWKVFLKTGHHGVPTPRYRMVRRNRRRVEKLLPLPLGLKSASEGQFPEPMEKTVDVFFAGRIEGSSTVRKRGIGELMALSDSGVTIDIAEKPLPAEAFYKRAAAARLVWSPEGFGWDCFRHYEAAMCGSVPLINHPTIERYQPLIGGEHAVYYDVEPGGLTRAVLEALADRERLAAMARTAKAFVQTHHTRTAVVDYVLQTTLARAQAAQHQ